MDAMVDVRHEDVQPVRRAGVVEEMQQRQGIGSAGDCDEHAASGRRTLQCLPRAEEALREFAGQR